MVWQEKSENPLTMDVGMIPRAIAPQQFRALAAMYPVVTISFIVRASSHQEFSIILNEFQTGAFLKIGKARIKSKQPPTKNHPRSGSRTENHGFGGIQLRKPFYLPV